MTTQFNSDLQEESKPGKPRVWVILVLTILMIAQFCLRKERKESEKIGIEMAEIVNSYMKQAKADEYKDKYLKYYTYDTCARNEYDSVLSVVYDIGTADGKIATLGLTVDSITAIWYTDGEITSKKSRIDSLNDIPWKILKELAPSVNDFQKFNGYYSKPEIKQVIIYVKHIDSGIFYKKINLDGGNKDATSEKILENLAQLYKEMMN